MIDSYEIFITKANFMRIPIKLICKIKHSDASDLRYNLKKNTTGKFYFVKSYGCDENNNDEDIGLLNSS